MIKKYYGEVDLLKILAALGVVAIHTGAAGLNTLGRLAVPTFAIISGVFFFKKYDAMGSTQAQGAYFRHYCHRIFSLYLFWQVLYLPLVVKEWFHLESGKPLWWRVLVFVYRFVFPGHDYTAWGVFVSGTNGWGPSWYLIALLMGLPLFCLLLRWANMIVIGVLSGGLEILYILGSGYQFATHLYVWGILCFPRLFIYLFIGKIIADHLGEDLSSHQAGLVVLSAVLVVLFVLENLIISWLGGTPDGEEVLLTVPTSAVLVLTAFNLDVVRFDTKTMRGFSTFLYTGQTYFIGAGHFVSNCYLKLLLTIIAGAICYWIYLQLWRATNWKVLRYAV